MGIFTRPNSPYYWKRYDINPETGTPFRPRASTKIHVAGVTKLQRDQNKADAEHQYMQDCIEIRDGRSAAATPTRAPLYATYGAYIREYYLAHYTAHHRGADTETGVFNRLLREFGALPIEGITSRRVDAYRERRLKAGIKVSTVKREIQILRPSLRRMAQALRDAGGAAPDGRDILKDLPYRRPDETETRWFSEEEFATFIKTIDAHPRIAGIPRAEGLAMAVTAVQTLLRRGSLLRLTWKHYRVTYLVPLNAKQEIRRSPVTPQMREHLSALPQTTDRIFASFDRMATRAKQRGIILPEKRRRQAANNVTVRWFREVCRLAGLPAGRRHQGLTFHSFRHTGATWLLNGSETRLPVSPKTVMELGGWHDVELFMKTYCHTDQKRVDAAAASLFPTGVPGLPALAQHAHDRQQG